MTADFGTMLRMSINVGIVVLLLGPMIGWMLMCKAREREESTKGSHMGQGFSHHPLLE